MTDNTPEITDRLKKLTTAQIPFHWFFSGISACILGCTAAGYFGRFWWFFDLFVHFKFQYMITALICGMILSFKKRFIKYASFCYLVALINSVEIVPLYFPRSSINAPPIDKRIKLRIMHANIQTSNTKYQQLTEYVLKEAPDILLLEEMSGEWVKKLKGLDDLYPYKKLFPQSDNFGIGLFSRIPFIEVNILFNGKFQLPYIKAHFKIRDKNIKFWGIHPLPPVGRTLFRERNQMLNNISELVSESKDSPIILIGDLNITPWSYYFKKFEQKSGLVNTQKGFGIQPTWPTILPPLLIPIDHCLVSPSVTVENYRAGQNIGSDHYPLIIDLSL